jgi:hypothetical protein
VPVYLVPLMERRRRGIAEAGIMAFDKKVLDLFIKPLI